MPVPNDLHIDRWLTDLSVAFVQDDRNFVFDKVFPVVPVNKQSDKFVIYERGSFWRDQMKERPLGGRADVAEWDKTEGTYRCVERALAHKIDDRQRANTDDPLDLDRAATRLLSTAVAVNNDARWANAYFQTGVWTTDRVGTTDFVKFDAATPGNPITVIDAEKETIMLSTALMPNTLVVGAAVHRVLRNHPDILERIKYTQRAIIDEDILANIFGVDRYIVARGVYNTAKEGQTDNFDWLVDDEGMLLCYAAPNPGLETPSAGYTFAWSNLLGGQANAMGGVMQRGRDAFAHSDHFEIRTATDIQQVSADLGVFFSDCIT